MARLIVCPLCGKKNFQVVFEKTGRRIIKCLDDGLVFVNPQPSAKEIAGFYDADYFQNLDPYLKNKKAHLKYFGKKIEQIEKKQEKDRKKTETERRWRQSRKGEILDIGCGAGYFLQTVQKSVCWARGIDVSDWAVDYCRRQGLMVKKSTVEKAGLPANSFEVIVSFQTIEHEIDPVNFGKHIFRLLKPGGLVMITTPNYDSWTRRLMGKNWFGYRHQEHLFFFSPKSLDRALREAGFEQVEIRRDDPRVFSLNYSLTRLANFYPYSFIRRMTGVLKITVGRLPLPMMTDPWGDLIAFGKK